MNTLAQIFESTNLVTMLTHDGIVLFVCLLLTCVATLIDMWTGVEAAKAVGEPLRSRSLRKTASKTLDYWRVLVFGTLIDLLGLFFPWYTLPYFIIVCTAGVLLIEGKSVIENMRKKRSHAADVPTMVNKIVKALTTEDAKKILKEIQDISSTSDKS